MFHLQEWNEANAMFWNKAVQHTGASFLIVQAAVFFIIYTLL